MDYDSLLELVKKRRSIRRFKPDPIPDNYITKIIEIARWAPSGFNMQPWEFVVVKKPELRKRIVEFISEIRPLTKNLEKTREPWMGKVWQMTGLVEKDSDYTMAPVYIILLGDPRTNAGLPMFIRNDQDTGRMIYQAGLANAFIYMHLAATTLGLASQWISITHTVYVQGMIKDLLGIPPEFEVFDMIALGYPAIEPNRKLMRETDEMIHYDDCGKDDFRDISEVREFIRRARNWTIGAHRRKSKDGNKASKLS